jgi:hypothetical protein
MKTISKFVIFFLVTIALTACQDDTGQETIHSVSDIKIANGMIQSPEWLVNEVNSVADQYQQVPGGEKPYPWVYLVKYDGQEYILLSDFLNSCWTCGHLYFTLSGDTVYPESDPRLGLYGALEEAREENAVLLWRNNLNNSTSTRAFVNEVSVHTPNGAKVSDTWYRSEEINTSAAITAVLNALLFEYPRASTSPNPYATILSDPTSTYNCHAYAWHMTEGGSPVWMGRWTNPTNAYVDDDSYIATSSNTSNAKVMYLNDNHSAIAETSNVFVSKWGMQPLMRHSKDYSPYNSSQLAYYTRAPSPVITGPDYPSLNTNVTYSVPAPPFGVTFNNWTVTPSTYVATGGLNNRNLTVRFTAAGTYTLSANFTLPNSTTYSATRTIDLRTPTITSVSVWPDVAAVRPGQLLEFTANGINLEQCTIEWEPVSGCSRLQGHPALGGTGPIFSTIAASTGATAAVVRYRILYGGVYSAWAERIVPIDVNQTPGTLSVSGTEN